jgi:very-short-patch-repair endonuclease
MAQSALEAEMALQIRAAGLPEPEREWHFCERRFRLDFAWPDRMLALEVDGGQFVPHGGRHNTDGDRAKLNRAAILGWTVLRASGAMVKSGEALRTVEEAMRRAT